MFSLDNFYYVLYKNLLKPVQLPPLFFSKFGSTNKDDLELDNFDRSINNKNKRDNFQNDLCFFYDQEPLIVELLENIDHHLFLHQTTLKVFANSEKSEYKKIYCKNNNFLDWYYFFHGFAALDWYRDYKYIPKVENKFSKVFISLNRLVVKDRSYRLNLVANYMEQGLLEYGHVSLGLINNDWKEEVTYSNSKLSTQAKGKILKYISCLKGPLIVDQENVPGYASAGSGDNEMMLQQSALWHVVSETVFYYPKLHLTEKIFKPIVHRRPFILVAAPGNLAYLKSYGFKTFDRWIDESYDTIEDNDQRIQAITQELAKLCKLNREELETMYQEMQEILDYNFNHFYGDFNRIIVDELVDNFRWVLSRWNNGRFDIDGRGVLRDYTPTDHIDFEAVKQRLLG
jgi:hypothetical protein